MKSVKILTAWLLRPFSSQFRKDQQGGIFRLMAPHRIGLKGTNELRM